MGFRDLESFNKALLSKQLWKILQTPDSLSARIFKPKYFNHGSILFACLGCNLSYAQRTLYAAQDLLKVGNIQRVGNDNQIRIWKDKWLPHSLQFPSVPPLGYLSTNAMVLEPIDWEAQDWKFRWI